jgi:hypothetical protein
VVVDLPPLALDECSLGMERQRDLEFPRPETKKPEPYTSTSARKSLGGAKPFSRSNRSQSTGRPNGTPGGGATRRMNSKSACQSLDMLDASLLTRHPKGISRP